MLHHSIWPTYKCFKVTTVIIVLAIILTTPFWSWPQWIDANTEGQLIRLPLSVVQSHGAYCLDGSEPGYYIRHGEYSGQSSWIIHLQAGAWCQSPEECYQRSFTDLGSTMRAQDSLHFDGILSADPVANPDFHTWNMVQVIYCDGGSYAGNHSDPLMFGDRQLFLRGLPILVAVLEYLSETTNLQTAHRVLLTGSSAGGLSALIHADFIRGKLPHVENYHVICDGGLFPDLKDNHGASGMGVLLEEMFKLHSIHKNPALNKCVADKSTEHQWECLLPSNLIQHRTAPVFYINSFHDRWYHRAIFGIHCISSIRRHPCSNDDMRLLAKYRTGLTETTKSVKDSSKDGLYLTSVFAHTFLFYPDKFVPALVDDVSVQEALRSWYFGSRTKEHYYVDKRSTLEALAVVSKMVP